MICSYIFYLLCNKVYPWRLFRLFLLVIRNKFSYYILYRVGNIGWCDFLTVLNFFPSKDRPGIPAGIIKMTKPGLFHIFCAVIRAMRFKNTLRHPGDLASRVRSRPRLRRLNRKRAICWYILARIHTPRRLEIWRVIS